MQEDEFQTSSHSIECELDVPFSKKRKIMKTFAEQTVKERSELLKCDIINSPWDSIQDVLEIELFQSDIDFLIFKAEDPQTCFWTGSFDIDLTSSDSDCENIVLACDSGLENV